MEAVLDQLTETGPDDIASAVARAFELVMRLKRERCPGAGNDERTDARKGHANATLPKRIDTAAAGAVRAFVRKTVQ